MHCVASNAGRRKQPDISAEQERWLSTTDDADDSKRHSIADDTLRMLFVCFHPQLSSEAQMALALRTVCGLSAGEIAAAFLTSEAAIAKRLVRARQRIRELALPFAVPDNSRASHATRWRARRAIFALQRRLQSLIR